MNCIICKDTVTDSVKCSQCKGNLHFGCAGLAESSYRRMGADKKASWRCGPCRNSEFSPSAPTILEVLQEVKQLRSEFQEIKQLRTDISTVKTDIQNASSLIEKLNLKWNEMEPRFSDVEDRLAILEKKVSTISKLQSDLDAANDTISNLKHENKQQNQFLRMNNVEISGVVFTKGENLASILQSIFLKVGLSFDMSVVDSIHRVRRFETSANKQANGNENTRPPAIIVKFTRRLCKDQLLSAVRARRGLTSVDVGISGPCVDLFIGDHLTPDNKLLLKKARALKTELNYAYLWVRDCKIFLRKSEKSKVIRITTETDLKHIK